MQESLTDFTAAGVTLVALTPQVPARSLEMVEKHALGFDLLSDPENAYAAALGLRFTLPEELRPIYQSFGIDLLASNGDGSTTLPMPGRMVVDARGIVRAVEVDPDYTRRPEPAQTLAQARALSA